MDQANKLSGVGVSGQGSDDQISHSHCEDAGLATLEGLSLEALGALAAQEIGEARQLQAEAVGLSRRSTATLYRAGRVLWCARKKLKGKGKRAWTKWQKANGIPVTSAWQAIRLYEEAEGEEAVAGLTRSQALKMYGITKPKKAQPQQPPEGPGEVERAGAEVARAIDPPVSTPTLRLVAEKADQAKKASPSPAEPSRPTEAVGSMASPTTPPAEEILVPIVRRLEILEQDIRGNALGDDALALIDRAIATLRRLRGDDAAEAA